MEAQQGMDLSCPRQWVAFLSNTANEVLSCHLIQLQFQEIFIGTLFVILFHLIACFVSWPCSRHGGSQASESCRYLEEGLLWFSTAERPCLTLDLNLSVDIEQYMQGLQTPLCFSLTRHTKDK